MSIALEVNFFSSSFITVWNCQENFGSDVLSNCQGDGVPGWLEVCTQRSSSKELSVSMILHSLFKVIYPFLKLLCSVDAAGLIKVSDFGLAEDMYSQNYFRQVQGGTKLPLKWMALESITQGKFTEKTDVVIQ